MVVFLRSTKHMERSSTVKSIDVLVMDLQTAQSANPYYALIATHGESQPWINLGYLSLQNCSRI